MIQPPNNSKQIDTATNEWRLIQASSFKDQNNLTQNIEGLVQLLSMLPITLKDDKRSLVKQGELFDKTIIAKQPRDKNRRLWIRILSFFRDSEVLSTQKTLSRFSELGIESVTPLCVLEKRKFGCLIDSWIIYEFREGKESSLTQLPEIIELLQQLHSNGFRHDDPNFGNFLIEPSGKMFLIDCKGKQRLGFFSDYYDFMLLSQRNSGIPFADLIKSANIDTQRFGFRLAKLYVSYKRKRTELKTKKRARAARK